MAGYRPLASVTSSARSRALDLQVELPTSSSKFVGPRGALLPCHSLCPGFRLFALHCKAPRCLCRLRRIPLNWSPPRMLTKARDGPRAEHSNIHLPSAPSHSSPRGFDSREVQLREIKWREKLSEANQTDASRTRGSLAVRDAPLRLNDRRASHIRLRAARVLTKEVPVLYHHLEHHAVSVRCCWRGSVGLGRRQ